MKASNLRKGDVVSARMKVNGVTDTGCWLQPCGPNAGDKVWVPQNDILGILECGDEPEIGTPWGAESGEYEAKRWHRVGSEFRGPADCITWRQVKGMGSAWTRLWRDGEV